MCVPQNWLSLSKLFSVPCLYEGCNGAVVLLRNAVADPFNNLSC